MPHGRSTRSDWVARSRPRAGPVSSWSPRSRRVVRPRRARGASGGTSGVMQALTDLGEGVRERLRRDAGEVTPHRVAEALRASGRPVGDATVLAVHEALRRDVVGAGPLEPLLRMPDVTDVLVNGCDQVYVDRGQGLEGVDVLFPSDESVRRLAQ